MSDVTLLSWISGLSFDFPFLSPHLFFLPNPLALSVLSCFLLMVHSPDVFSQVNSQTFFIKRHFCMALVEQLGRGSW